MLRKFFKKAEANGSDSSGFTLLELLLSLLLTSVLGLGISNLLGSSIKSMNYVSSNSVSGANFATLNSLYAIDVNQSNGYVVPSTSGILTSASTPAALFTITSATWDNSISPEQIKYSYSTADARNLIQINQMVSISGFTGTDTGFNASNAKVVTSTCTTSPSNCAFTITPYNSALFGAATKSAAPTPGAQVLSTQCSTWDSASARNTATAVQPLTTIAQQFNLKVTSVSAVAGTPAATSAYKSFEQINFLQTGADLTHIFSVGQSVSLSGFATSPTDYTPLNTRDVPIYAVGVNSITVPSNESTSIAISAAQLGGAEIISSNYFVGYEVRTISGSGQLWRIACDFPGQGSSTVAVTRNAFILRDDLPLPFASGWSNSILCAISDLSEVACGQINIYPSFVNPSNIATSITGLAFTVPKSLGTTGKTAFNSQLVTGARSTS